MGSVTAWQTYDGLKYGPPSSVTIEGNAPAAQSTWGEGPDSVLDTGQFSVSSGKLIIVITRGTRDGGAVSTIASVVVDPGGVALSLTKATTEYDDTFTTISLWYGYAPSILTNVVARATATATVNVYTLFAFTVSNAKTSSPIGSMTQAYLGTPNKSVTLTSCTAGSVLISFFIDGGGAMGVTTPYTDNTYLFQRTTFLAGFIASRSVPSAGDYAVGAQNLADGNDVKAAAWEILKA